MSKWEIDILEAFLRLNRPATQIDIWKEILKSKTDKKELLEMLNKDKLTKAETKRYYFQFNEIVPKGWIEREIEQHCAEANHKKKDLDKSKRQIRYKGLKLKKVGPYVLHEDYNTQDILVKSIEDYDQLNAIVFPSEDIDDKNYQLEVLYANVSKNEIDEYIEKQEGKPSKNKANSGPYWARDPKLAKIALYKQNFNCQIDMNHKTFISALTNTNFVEAHHLIPMKNQDDFDSPLDVVSNIVALCPNCHRKIHHSSLSERIKMTKELYENRKTREKAQGLYIKIEDLVKLI